MTTIHENSLAAYHAGRLSDFGAREQMILRAYEQLGSATDREVRDYLGFADGNAVKPRISELIGAGVLEEIGTKMDPITKRPGHIVRIRPMPDAAGQLKLFDAA